ncbi:hypothetical protein HaLaN_01615 [Haematococcus lacustris]|uniref:Uncharacterized protein n=1 Tax=Haematococcus lacustris TaxID=44745 RepID=A0A699YLK5_HAELA|nr:hypothetical protein HaLaN_01615 [Haematococcus lacustris]
MCCWATHPVPKLPGLALPVLTPAQCYQQQQGQGSGQPEQGCTAVGLSWCQCQFGLAEVVLQWQRQWTQLATWSQHLPAAVTHGGWREKKASGAVTQGLPAQATWQAESDTILQMAHQARLPRLKRLSSLVFKCL